MLTDKPMRPRGAHQKILRKAAPVQITHSCTEFESFRAFAHVVTAQLAIENGAFKVFSTISLIALICRQFAGLA